MFQIETKGNGHPIIWSEEQLAYIVEEYRDRVPVKQIADKFGVSAYTIRKVVKKHASSEYRTLSEQSQTYTRNSKFFDVIDSEEKAYWLGFLYADGSIDTNRNDVKLSLAERDRGHLEKFKISLESNAPIREEEKTIQYSEDDVRTYKQNIVLIGDVYMVKQLEKLGCGHNKTLTLTYPKLLDEKYDRHFIRGYFDGDGSIHEGHAYKPTGNINYKMNLCGTKEMLNTIKDKMGVGHLKLYSPPESNVYYLYISGNLQVEEKMRYLYEDSSIYLDRKHKFLDEIIEYNL